VLLNGMQFSLKHCMVEKMLYKALPDYAVSHLALSMRHDKSMVVNQENIRD